MLLVTDSDVHNFSTKNMVNHYQLHTKESIAMTSLYLNKLPHNSEQLKDNKIKFFKKA